MELEKIINKRWEIAQKLYPNATREDVARLVYALAEFAGAFVEKEETEIKAEKSKLKV